MTDWLFGSIRSRLIFLVVLAVCPGFVLAWQTAQQHRKLASADVQKDATRLVRLTLDNELRVLYTARQLLIALAATDHEFEEPNRCNMLVAAIMKENSDYSNIGAARPDGEVFCSALPLKGPVNLSDRGYFKKAIANKSFSPSEYQIGRITGKPVLVFAYPLLNKRHAVESVLFITIGLDWLNSVLALADTPKQTSLTVIDRTGTVLAHYPDPGKWSGKSVAETSVGKIVLAEKQGVTEVTGLEGGQDLVAFASRPDGIAVFASIPQDVAFADVTRIFHRNLWGIGIVGLIALIAAWIGGQWTILRPVNALIGTTEQLSAGDLSARTQLHSGKAELGRLAGAVDRMAISLERRYTELQTLRDIDVSILSTLDLHASLEILLDKIECYLPYAAATVKIYNTDTGLLEAVAWRRIDLYGRDAHLKSDFKTLPHLVFESKVRMVLDIASTKTDDREFLIQQGFKSYVGIPLEAKGDFLGVLSFFGKQEQVFAASEIEFLTTLAGQMSIAINNALLYDRTKQQAIDLKASNKVKDEFLSVMSHELRTPLNVIKGYAEIVKDGTLGDVSAAQVDALTKLMRCTSGLTDMTDEILVATAIESRSVKADMEATNLDELLNDLKANYCASSNEKDLELTWNLSANLPAVKTDRVKLRRTLQNLIDNAIKFTEQGSVTVSASYRPEAKTVAFTVADTGIGIPKGLHEAIFEIFRQADSSDIRPHEGVGLGLFIAKQFTVLLGGNITIESEPGRGSLFTVSIPVET